MKFFLIGVLMIMATVACEQLVMEPEPSSDKLAVFDEYMNVVATKFGMLEIKQVNAKALADSLRPFVSNSMTDSAFLSVLQVVVDRLQEGHTSVVKDDTTSVGYAYYLNSKPGLNIVTLYTYYSSRELNPDYREIGSESYTQIVYHRLLQDTSIGYIRIPSFSITVSSQEIESMLRDLAPTKGLIIDVRSNLGGFIDVAYKLASYFASSTKVVGTNVLKTGPGSTDQVPSTISLSPSSSTVRYTKPVYVLTDNITFSSASLFSNAMSALPTVTTLGAKNGGGCGSVATGVLGNGWRWTMPTSHFIDHNGVSTHDGQVPEIELPYNVADREHDTYIDEAIRRLSP